MKTPQNYQRIGDGQPVTYLSVPIDAHNERPLITSAMKSQCMGEHSFRLEEECVLCLLEGPSGDCECCHGDGYYLREFTVPWTTAKAIYKDMAEAAARGED